jgi:hypothetical protein
VQGAGEPDSAALSRAAWTCAGLDSEWKYVNGRQFLILIKHSINDGTQSPVIQAKQGRGC